jgi:hypothetical protein
MITDLLSYFLSALPFHPKCLSLISKFTSSSSVAFYRPLLDTLFGHHILKMYLRHRLTKVWILRRISLVTSHVSRPNKSTDFTQALKILIFVSFRIDVDSHIFLNLENDPLAFWIPTFTCPGSTVLRPNITQIAEV